MSHYKEALDIERGTDTFSGVDLSTIVTRSDLQSGIEYALHRLWRKIVPLS